MKYKPEDIHMGMKVKGKYGKYPIQGKVIEIRYNYLFEYEYKIKGVIEKPIGTGGILLNPWIKLHEIEEVIEPKWNFYLAIKRLFSGSSK